MKLTLEQTEEAARTVYRASHEAAARPCPAWEQVPEDYREEMRKLVRNLAGLLDVPESPEAFLVFMVWMGKPIPNGFHPTKELMAALEAVDVDSIPEDPPLVPNKSLN